MIYAARLYMYTVLTINHKNSFMKTFASYKVYVTSQIGYHTRPPSLPLGVLARLNLTRTTVPVTRRSQKTNLRCHQDQNSATCLVQKI